MDKEGNSGKGSKMGEIISMGCVSAQADLASVFGGEWAALSAGLRNRVAMDFLTSGRSAEGYRGCFGAGDLSGYADFLLP